MPRMVRRLGAVLFWSVIAAAFIGPGTVTTAGAAGAGFGYALLWTVVFSTLACLVLQEASARLTIVSGLDLGQALRLRYRGRSLPVLVLGAVILGCSAYEAGNILGGVAGAALALDLPGEWTTSVIVAGAALLLARGRARSVARLLGLLVAVMGVAFLLTAWRLRPDPADLLRGALWPAVPAGSGWLALGLVGTTVVPYNLFLGSGLARGQSLAEMRFGLSVAVGLGGLISMAVVVAGGALSGPFGFEELSRVLALRIGPWARGVLAAGLFAAGASSAVTAPLAAAVTARGLLARTPPGEDGEHTRLFRSVWGGVLLVGLAFGLAGTPPVPAIVAAQALNGVLLPFVAISLLLCVNDRGVMGGRVNARAGNGALVLVVGVTLLLGVHNVVRAVARTLALPSPPAGAVLAAAGAVALAVAFPLWRRLRHARHG